MPSDVSDVYLLCSTAYDSKTGQRRPRSDCAFVQSDLGLSFPHTWSEHFSRFNSYIPAHLIYLLLWNFHYNIYKITFRLLRKQVLSVQVNEYLFHVKNQDFLTAIPKLYIGCILINIECKGQRDPSVRWIYKILALLATFAPGQESKQKLYLVGTLWLKIICFFCLFF